MDLFSKDTKFLPIALPQEKGYDYKWNDAMAMFEINVPNGKILYHPNYFDQATSDFTASLIFCIFSGVST